MSSDWHDDTSWYRDEKGELMCNTCKSDVFGGLCDCYQDDSTDDEQVESKEV